MLNHCFTGVYWASVHLWTLEPLETWTVIFNCHGLKISFKGRFFQSDPAHEDAHGMDLMLPQCLNIMLGSSWFSKGLAKVQMKVWSLWEIKDLSTKSGQRSHFIHTLPFRSLGSVRFLYILGNLYKPDSKKVGTLYKLWIKTECNDVEVSNFNILFRIQHRWYQMFKLRKCIILREK